MTVFKLQIASERASVLVFGSFLWSCFLLFFLSLSPSRSRIALIAHSFCLWMLNDAFIWNVCSYLKLKRFFLSQKQSHLSRWARSIGFFCQMFVFNRWGVGNTHTHRTSIHCHEINNSYFGKSVWSCLYRMNIKCVVLEFMRTQMHSGCAYKNSNGINFPIEHSETWELRLLYNFNYKFA